MMYHRPGTPAHRGRRRPAMLLAMLGLAPFLAGCSSDSTSGLELDAPVAVREFIAGQSLDGIHGYQPLLVDPPSRFLLFEVSYGASAPCIGACGYPAAVGLALGNRIGWLVAPTGAVPTTLLVVQPTDTLLFQTELLVRVGYSDAGAGRALKIAIARMPAAPPATLSYIVADLHCCQDDSIGLALLANPNVRSDGALLETLAGRLWLGATHDLAWTYLAALVGPVSSLGWSGAPLTLSPPYAGYASAVATALNRTARRIAFEVPSVCAPSLLVYRDSAYTTRVWDGGRWQGSQAGGCKASPVLRAIAPGDSMRFTAAQDPAIILGDSLPAGRYYLGIRPDIYYPTAGPAVVRAGPMDLKR